MARAARLLCALCVLCGLPGFAFALDREAFTFTKYNLTIRIEPRQQRLAVEGQITLRNDSASPQKNVALQISSTLGWRSIEFEGKPVPFVSDSYTSDIDHTGFLSEALVTLPREVPVRAAIELKVRYEGTVPLDATRLTRIGAPEDVAQHSDWDQITPNFAAVRGVGYVAWYPVAMDAVSLSDGDSLFEALGRWKQKETESTAKFTFELSAPAEDAPVPTLLCNGDISRMTSNRTAQSPGVDCSYEAIGFIVPTFVVADYAKTSGPGIAVYTLGQNRGIADLYNSAAAKAVSFVRQSLRDPVGTIQVAELPDAKAAPFESGSLFLTPPSNIDTLQAELTAVHQFAHAALKSPRPWIYEGWAHFAEAAYLERESGRQPALALLGQRREAVADAEKAIVLKHAPESEMGQSLINTYLEEFYRAKAAFVWWMLRDMVGEEVFKKALASYRADQDKEPSYIQRLIEAQSHRDLEWFFDDWVYRDRGLPDFRVDSVFPREMLPSGYMVTVTVENLGRAGAEVPVTVRTAEGEVTKRLEVRGKSKSSIRIEVATFPVEVVVNDGSVPESDVSNNAFKIEK